MKQTFSYSQRLHQSEVFEGALKTKAKVDKWLAVHSKSNSIGYDRLGIVVSKRIIPKASGRNRIKRLIREVFRKSLTSNLDTLDIVVRLRSKVLLDETIEFRQTMSRLLMKVRMAENDTPISIVHKKLSVSD